MHRKSLFADRCRNLRACFRSAAGGGRDDFAMAAKLEGHVNGITGIATDVSSGKLYTSDRGGIVRVWDCAAGKCTKVVNFGRVIGCMMLTTVNSLVLLVGTIDGVKIWNTQRDIVEQSLSGPVGQIYALATSQDEHQLFAGAQDGDITAWKLVTDSISGTKAFQRHSSMVGHTRAVISMVAGSDFLYSGSMDHTIRIWSVATLQCVRTLRGHSEDVTSLICWTNYLISCSTDHTIKLWAMSAKGGQVEEIHSRNEGEALLKLDGMFDGDGKPLLLCSCADESVRILELPSLMERGRVFGRDLIRAIDGRAGPFFVTGDWSGLVTRWKCNKEPA